MWRGGWDYVSAVGEAPNGLGANDGGRADGVGIQTLAVHSSRSPPPFPPNPPQPKRKTQFNPTGSHTSNLHAVASSEATCIDKAVPSHSRSSPPATIIFPPKGITLFFPPSETARGNMAGWDLWLFVWRR